MPFLLAPVLAATASGAVVGSVALTVPQRFHRYSANGGLVVTDYALSVRSPFRWRGVFPQALPGNRVAFELELWLGLGPRPPARLQLPLSLDQPWTERRVRAGTRYYGWFDYRRREYEVFAWTGRRASRRDLAALARALASVEARSA